MNADYTFCAVHLTTEHQKAVKKVDWISNDGTNMSMDVCSVQRKSENYRKVRCICSFWSILWESTWDLQHIIRLVGQTVYSHQSFPVNTTRSMAQKRWSFWIEGNYDGTLYGFDFKDTLALHIYNVFDQRFTFVIMSIVCQEFNANVHVLIFTQLYYFSFICIIFSSS